MARTVLIVEDEPSLATLLRDVLSDAGYDVVLSAAGTAVERAERFRPDAIIVDYGMPVLTGAEVIEQLRERQGERMPPVILVTGRSEAVAIAADVGADAYLRKPFDVVDLVEMVGRLTSGGAAM